MICSKFCDGLGDAMVLHQYVVRLKCFLALEADGCREEGYYIKKYSSQNQRNMYKNICNGLAGGCNGITPICNAAQILKPAHRNMIDRIREMVLAIQLKS